jgi:hypothetical protein
MHRRSAATRLVMLGMIAALLAGVAGTSVAQARDGRSTDRHVRYASDPERESGGTRSFRHVDVSSLPAATGKGSPYQATLRRPSGGFSGAAPDIQGALPPPPVQATSNGDPVINQATAFNGLGRASGPATNGEPPDPWIATGPEHVFQAVNTTFRISKRSGSVIQTVDMFNFFGLGQFYDPTQNEVAYFDPRVIYDSLHARWIAIEASFDCFANAPQANVGYGYLDIAISDGADPLAGWSILSLEFPDAVPDYPGIGTSTDKVVVSANIFGLAVDGSDLGCNPQDDMYQGTELDAMAWSQLTGTGDVTVVSDFPGVNTFSWRPALQTPATSPTVFAVAEDNDDGVLYARIDGNPVGGHGGMSFFYDDLSLNGIIAPFAAPPPPKQPGPPAEILRAVDARPTDAVWKGNKLDFVSTYPCDPIGGVDAEVRDCVRVSELRTSVTTAPTLIQDFLIAEEGADLFMGGIGYALNDDLHVVWARSSESAGQYPSSYGAYQDAAAPNSTISERVLLTPGALSYDGTRWGDYVGVAQDPQVPNAVWQGNQYAVGSGARNWGTEVTQLQTGGSTYVPITPNRVLDTRPGITIGLSGPFSHGVARSWQVAGFSSGDIPTNAIAVTGNLTVANQTAGGYVSVTSSPNNNPSSSTINFPVGDNRANNLTIPIAPGGKISAVYRATAGKTTHLIFDVTGYFVAGGDEFEYKTITPVRALDSRPGISIGLSGPFPKDVPQKLTISNALVPAAAVAITGNLTVVGQTGAGYLAIGPSEDSTPPTSNLNFPLGDTRANGFASALGLFDELFIVYKTTASGPRSTHVILDITGYFVDDPAGMQYFPLTPGRIMDSRGFSLSGPTGFFNTNVPRKLVVGSHWGVPASAGAITGNLTAVSQTAPGYVAVTLTNNPNPTTSNLNFPLGDTRANGITVPLSATKDVWIVYKTTQTGKRTHLILDVSGYFD